MRACIVIAIGVSQLIAVAARAQPAPDAGKQPQVSSEVSKSKGSVVPPYDLTWHITDEAWLRPYGFAQLRWTGNYREEVDSGSDDEFTSAFTVPRVRLHLQGGVTEYLGFTVRLGTLSSGTATFEQAFADFNFGPLHIRAGQFHTPLVAEEEPRPDLLQSVDFSQLANTFGSGQSGGAGMFYDAGFLRAHLYTTNGLRTGFAEVQGPLNAKYEVMSRLEFKPLDNSGGWDRFVDRSSFRGGDTALRFGVSGHFQEMRDSFALPNATLAVVAADVTVKGDGWNALANGVWSNLDAPEGGLDGGGVFVQAGVFLLDRWEIFGAYDVVLTDGRPYPTDEASQGTTDYHSVLAGTNVYLTPHEHRAKLQLDAAWAFNPMDTSLVATTSNTGLLPTTQGGQAAVRLQLVLGF